ncbi:MAG: helix-turn-helix transcriptional regulator [Clostridia bacterium]|nr:helix-turn-helix transcriptional regulator [Clostridia bacterium]
MTVNDAVAKRVLNLLAENKMTQYRLEQLSGIQHGHMQWIMSGKSKTVTLSTVMMLACGFGMTVLEFLDDELFNYDNLEIE